ncbi:MAG: Gfo/Idh/MocA family oxidoreductase [Ginsengibacter sp.]
MYKMPGSRRKFIKNISLTAVALSQSGIVHSRFKNNWTDDKKRIGIIGLDTSHSIEFTKLINGNEGNFQNKGYRVTAAYPRGSADIESAVSRIPEYTETIKKMGVEIVDSIDELLKKTDFILLETNDGRIHLQQALKVIAAGKPLFIDKPIATSLKDAKVIFDAAERKKVPVFSSSVLRFTEEVQAAAKGEKGKVLGADTYSPAHIEKTHPDFFWYGVHGIEMLFAVMGTGCKKVTRIHTDDSDVAVGTWEDGRVGTFRGLHIGKLDFGGVAFGEKEIFSLGKFDGYENLVSQIINFFETGHSPVDKNETLEIIAFMEAADESKRSGGIPVSLKL